MPRPGAVPINTIPKKKNQLLNSDFFIAQRTGGNTTAFSGTLYLADRWKNSTSDTSATSHSISTLPGGFPGSDKITRASRVFGNSSNSSALVVHQQRVESVRALEMNSDIVSTGVWVYASNFQEVRVTILIPTAGENNYATSTQIIQTTIPISENTWEFISVENQNLTDRSNGYLVDFAFANPSNTTGAFDTYITQAMCNEGATLDPWSLAEDSFDKELMVCQRYYEKSYHIGTAPGQSASLGSFHFTSANGNNGGTILHIPFRVRKRATTVSNVYNTDGTINEFRNITALTDIPAETVGDSETGFYVRNTAATSTGHVHRFQWAADAEL